MFKQFFNFMKKKLLFKSLYEKKVDNITISKNQNDINQISNTLEIELGMYTINIPT